MFLSTGRRYREGSWKALPEDCSADGRPAYPALPMFKLLLLQRWYGLSDPGLGGSGQRAESPRLYSLQRILRLKYASLITLPSAGSGNALLELNLFERLFEEINRQLEEQGILVRESNGAIVDATIVESSRRPRKVIEIMLKTDGKTLKKSLLSSPTLTTLMLPG